MNNSPAHPFPALLLGFFPRVLLITYSIFNWLVIAPTTAKK